MSTYTQGAAALYPGLCDSALTARAGQYIVCEQVVRVNKEQSHFGYNKLDTLANKLFYFQRHSPHLHLPIGASRRAYGIFPLRGKHAFCPDVRQRRVSVYGRL